jgi:hypothetical protein
VYLLINLFLFIHSMYFSFLYIYSPMHLPVIWRFISVSYRIFSFVCPFRHSMLIGTARFVFIRLLSSRVAFLANIIHNSLLYTSHFALTVPLFAANTSKLATVHSSARYAIMHDASAPAALAPLCEVLPLLPWSLPPPRANTHSRHTRTGFGSTTAAWPEFEPDDTALATAVKSTLAR